MDIATQVEVVLRDAAYDTWTWTAASPSITCFENAALMGFVHVFESRKMLMQEWPARQQTTLARFSPAIRAAGAKAWNIYSVFLTADGTTERDREFEQIEEDFSLTRKIARATIQTPDDVERALLPLISVKAKPMLGASNFEARLRGRLKDVSPDAVTALLDDASGVEVARILGANL